MTITPEMIEAGLVALDHDPAITDESRVRLILEAGLRAMHPMCTVELAKTYHDSLLAVQARNNIELEQSLEECRLHCADLAEERDQREAELKELRESVHSLRQIVQELRAQVAGLESMTE
jgi:septal ring factor EnvC (AmiA/AmiB activator)